MEGESVVIHASHHRFRRCWLSPSSTMLAMVTTLLGVRFMFYSSVRSKFQNFVFLLHTVEEFSERYIPINIVCVRDEHTGDGGVFYR